MSGSLRFRVRMQNTAGSMIALAARRDYLAFFSAMVRG